MSTALHDSGGETAEVQRLGLFKPALFKSMCVCVCVCVCVCAQRKSPVSRDFVSTCKYRGLLVATRVND